MGELPGLLLGYIAGVLSTLSPCVLPLLPMILIGALQQGAWGPATLALGLAVSFTLVGVAVASVGQVAGIEPSVLRFVVAGLMLLFGLAMLMPALHNRFAMAAAPIANAGEAVLRRLPLAGPGGQFLLGLLLGMVWAPCIGPTLGAAIGLAAQGDGIVAASATMLAFALGASTPIIGLGYGARQALTARRSALARFAGVAKPAMGLTLAALGLLVLTGLDKVVETALTNSMPAWLIALTTSV